MTLRTLTLALAAALVLTSAADARDWPRGTDIRADGVDSLLVQAPDGATRIVRDREPLSSGTPVTLPEGCEVAGFSTRYVAANCAADRVQLLDRTTGTWGPVPGEAAIRARLETSTARVGEALAVGAEAIELLIYGFKADYGLPFSIGTGAVGDVQPSAHEYATLDQPTAVAPLCAPVRTRARKEENDVTGGLFTVRQHARMAGDWTARWFDRGALELQRCGSRRVSTLTLAPGTEPVLTDRHLARVEDRRLHVRLLDSGHTVTRRLPHGDSRPQLETTGRWIVVQSSGGRVRTVEVPGARSMLPAGTRVLADGAHSLLLMEPGAPARIVSDSDPLTDGTPLEVPAGCTVAGFSVDHVLAECDGSDQLQMRDSGVWSPVPGDPPAGEPIGVGRRLMRLRTSEDQADGELLHDLQTGARVIPRPTETERVTLDTPTGLAPLCAPVRTARRLVRGSASDFPVLQDARQRGRWTVRWFAGTTRPIELQACGSSRTIVLGRAASDPILTSRYVAWIAADGLHVRDLREGRTTVRPAPGWSLEGTARRIVVAPLSGPVQVLEALE